MTDAVKLGVVGLLRGKDVTLELVNEKNVTVSAICDRSPEALKKGVEDFKNSGFENFEAFSSFDEMINNADIDAVYIATDAIDHVPYVTRALDAGKHVISEIPAINTVEEAKLLKQAVLRHPKLKYMTAENCFYWAFIQAWKSMYEEGKLGSAIYAESEYIHGSDIRTKSEKDYDKNHWRYYNPAIKYLTHNLGPLLYIMDDECVSVSCMQPDELFNPYRPDKNGVALFKTKKGAVIRILIIFDAFAGFDHNFMIMGTKGSLETDKVKPLNDAHTFARFMDIPDSIDEKIDIPVTLRFPHEAEGNHGGADLKMMQAFIKCIIEDTPSPIDVDMGIKITLPGIIAAESLKQGGKVLDIPHI
ncbi:MAG: Gfo/Idh/MocA family oxidoreductase [Clostridia bacterium]|nr:Gfo/Idh/MocA family oxidoreductase [Clostridia bacterium]